MRVLGIDPGIGTTGFGFVDRSDSSVDAVTYGAIRTPVGDADASRLVVLFDDLNSLIAEYRPDCVAVERLFVQRNVSTVVSVGQARGVIVLCAARLELPVFEYTPAQVKSAVVGNGRAPKGQVQDMVVRLLSLAVRPTPDDVADALAVALCHAQSQSFLNALSLS